MTDPVTLASGARCSVVTGAAGAALLLAGMITRRVRRRRRARAAHAWQALIATAAVTPGAYMCVVERVYQRARRGSKAVVVWTQTGQRQDAWFWAYRPGAGTTLLISGDSGYGPHNRNPHVFYVRAGGLRAAAPPGAQRAHQLNSTGKTPMEALRALKRRLSDIVYRQIVTDAKQVETGPGGHEGATLQSSAADPNPKIDTSEKSLPGPAEPQPRTPLHAGH